MVSNRIWGLAVFALRFAPAGRLLPAAALLLAIFTAACGGSDKKAPITGSPTGTNAPAAPAAAANLKAPAGADKESLPLINQPKAFEAGFTGAGTAVAVLDTGVNFKAAAFGPCTRANTPANTCRVVFAQDVNTDDKNPDDDGHGTNVSGIVAGVAPGTKLIVLDVFDRGKQSSDTAILAALDWVAKNKKVYNIVAVNMSLGSQSFFTRACGGTPYASAFANLRQIGVLPVVASGNSAGAGGKFTNGISSPACTPGALSVGAVYDANSGAYQGSCTDRSTKADQVTCFSQTGPTLGLLAPGSRITAASRTQSGTSQAAPHVAGAVAALVSKCPKATPDQVEKALVSSGPTITDPRNKLAKHRLDVFAAGQSLQAQGGCR
jgi:subtilisin family serine protease